MNTIAQPSTPVHSKLTGKYLPLRSIRKLFTLDAEMRSAQRVRIIYMRHAGHRIRMIIYRMKLRDGFRASATFAGIRYAGYGSSASQSVAGLAEQLRFVIARAMEVAK